MKEHCVSDGFLTERDLAGLLKRSLASIRRDRLTGRGCPYVKIGSSVRYSITDTEIYLATLPRHGGCKHTEVR